MEIKKKRDIYRMVASGGFIFYAVYGYLAMINSDWYNNIKYTWLKEDLELEIFFYAAIGLVILFCSSKGFINYIWLVSMAFADVLVLRLQGNFPVVRFFFYFLTSFVMILNARLFRGKIATVVTRFGWIALCLLYAGAITYMFINKKELFLNDAKLVFYIAAVFMVLYTMAMTLIPLKIFQGFVSKLFFVPALCWLYSMFFASSSGVATGTAVRLLAMVPTLNETVSCTAYCLYLSFIAKHKRELKSDFINRRQLLALPVIVLIAVIFAGNYLKLRNKDLGVRQNRADHTYRVLFYQNDDYNWYDIYGEKSLVKTRDLKNSIVLLSDDSLPVMFLSGGMVSEADGNTRMLIYDEESGNAKAVLGAWNGITIDGYCKADEYHKYPVIYCHGGHMGMLNELIYEFRDNKPFLVGEAQINDLPESNVPNEYTWDGQQVTEEEFNSKRDQALKGLKEIEWSDQFQ